MGARGPTNLELHRQLGLATALLDAGQVDSVRSRIAAVLKEPEAEVDGPLKAQALLLLARHDCEVGRCRRAIGAAQNAIQLFQSTGDIASEAAAVALLARASSGIGRDEEAVEAAQLSVRLGALLPAGAQQARLLNGLGMAYLWAQSFAAAESALIESAQLASSGAAPQDSLPPRINLAWLEVLRLFKERYFTGLLPETATLAQRVQACSGALSASLGGGTLVAAALQAQARCVAAMLHGWAGRIGAAAEQLLLARGVAQRLGSAHAVHFHLRWARAELDWSRGDLDAAQAEAAALIEAASHAEFEPMAQIGHSLRVQIHKRCGRYEQALDEERLSRRRELRIQADKLDCRQRAVQAHLEARASRDHVQRLSERSKELERLSYEDTLTAIANRRCFEHRLASLLTHDQSASSPLCLALVDLDDFKRINDSHSHSAGDEVLKSVAQALRGAVRKADLPARFGGDEFVILFPHTTLDIALQVCERIRATLATLRWPALSAALRVSASIGVAQAQPGDSPQALLERSDARMFRAKARGAVVAAA